MFERLGGIWFGLGLIAIWSLICALLAVDLWDPAEAADDRGEAIAQMVGLFFVFMLWLVVVIPTAWGIRRTGLR